MSVDPCEPKVNKNADSGDMGKERKEGRKDIDRTWNPEVKLVEIGSEAEWKVGSKLGTSSFPSW